MERLCVAPLLRPQPPWLLWHVAERADLLIETLRRSGCTWRSLRGPAMRTKDELLAELQIALRFPDYFGRNWDALHECLGDMGWLPAPDYTLVVIGASEVLAAEPSSELATFLVILRSVASRWAEPALMPDGKQRAAIPFHVVFQAEPSNFQRILQRATALDAAGNFGVLAVK
jgi:hypothetical protein